MLRISFSKPSLFLGALALLWSAAWGPVGAQTAAPDPWRIAADKVDPNHYYGATVANGLIGIVSAPVPFQVKSVVLAGAYDQ